VRIAGTTGSESFANVTIPEFRGPEYRNLSLVYLIPNGTRVKAGDVLAAIDPQEIVDHVEEIRDRVEGRTADVEKRRAQQQADRSRLQQTVLSAKAAFDKARLDYGAAETRTEIERELLKIAADEAEARYNQSVADQKQAQVGFAADVRILEIARQREASHMNRHAHDVERMQLRATMDGLVVVQSRMRSGELLPFRQGDQIQFGQTIAKVIVPDEIQLEGDLNQIESELVRLGQKAVVRIDAFPGLELPGRVHSISALAKGSNRDKGQVHTIPIRVRIDGMDPRILPDLSGSAEVQVSAEAEIKKIPLSAVHREDGKTVVYVKSAQGFERREVTLGVSNHTHAAVADGLDVGEEVALGKPAS
jgi:multidrug efflux pump subunit AcrA (membrane-fusion protein)